MQIPENSVADSGALRYRFGRCATGRHELRPNLLPVIRVKLGARHAPVRGQFKADAVFGIGFAATVAMTPLADLSVRLDDVSELAHTFTELRDGRRAGGREVLVEVHPRMLVALATNCKVQKLRVAHATVLL
jgi:uncharacterized spore protein YtfJ